MNHEYRRHLVSTINDPLGLGSFWEWYEKLSPGERNSALAPVMNKLRTILLRRNMRLVMGQTRPKFAMNDVFTKRKILLVNLAKGSLGSEASQLFGSLVVSQIWQATQSRANVPQDKRHPVFVYIDEMQDYLNLPTDIDEVLAQARSYGVGMILAHQHLGQLPKELKSAVLANARSRVCFQLTHDDAVAIAQSCSTLTPEDFESLPRNHIYAKLVTGGQVSNWMSGKTLPASEVTCDPDHIRRLSQERYGTYASTVDLELGKVVSYTARIGHKGITVREILDSDTKSQNDAGEMS